MPQTFGAKLRATRAFKGNANKATHPTPFDKNGQVKLTALEWSKLKAERNPKLLFAIPKEFHAAPPVIDAFEALQTKYGMMLLESGSPLVEHCSAALRAELAPALELLPMVEEGLNSCQDALLLLERLRTYLEMRMDAYFELPIDTLMIDVPRNLELYLDLLRYGTRKPGILIPQTKGVFCGKKQKTDKVYKMAAKKKIQPFEEGKGVEWPPRPAASCADFKVYVPPKEPKVQKGKKRKKTKVKLARVRYKTGGCISGVLFNLPRSMKKWGKHVDISVQHVTLFKSILGDRISAMKMGFEGRDLCKMLNELIDAVRVIQDIHKRALKHTQNYVHFVTSPKELPTTLERVRECVLRVPYYQDYLEELRVASTHPALMPDKQKELFDAIIHMESTLVHDAYPVILEFLESVWMLFAESEYVVDSFDVKGFIAGYIFDKLAYSDGVTEVGNKMRDFPLLMVKQTLAAFLQIETIRPHYVTECHEKLQLVGTRMLEDQVPTVKRALKPTWTLAPILLKLITTYTEPIRPRDLNHSEAGFVVMRFDYNEERKECRRLQSLLPPLYGPDDFYEAARLTKQSVEEMPKEEDGIPPEGEVEDLTSAGDIARQMSKQSLASLDKWTKAQFPKEVTSKVIIKDEENKAAQAYEHGSLIALWSAKLGDGTRPNTVPSRPGTVPLVGMNV